MAENNNNNMMEELENEGMLITLTDDEGNEINYVSSDDLVNLSQEDIEKMIEGREETLNKKNEGTA